MGNEKLEEDGGGGRKEGEEGKEEEEEKCERWRRGRVRTGRRTKTLR